MKKPAFPIHHTFGPLVTPEQWKKAWKLQFAPGKWHKGHETEDLRASLSQRFGMSASLFGTGRDALLAILRSLEFSAGDEVIIQAFTCVVVPNAVHAAQATPVYCDTDPQTLNVDMKKLQACITPRTKAIICQHTFGIPADTEKLRAICDKRNLALIEDCAHIVPDSSDTPIGKLGDAIILSFGRDKAISGVTGGAALTRHSVLAQKLADEEKQADRYSSWQILNFIDYPLRYQFAKWIWRTGLAKLYLRWVRLLKLLPPVLTKSEKEGRTDIRLKKLPNACASLALQQLKSLKRLNDHRRTLSLLYFRAAKGGEWNVPEAAARSEALQKFPVYAREADELRARLKREQIYLDDGWCNAVVNPQSVDQIAAGYAKGSCPVAEDVSKHLVSLPVHPTTTEEQARYVIHAVQSSLS